MVDLNRTSLNILSRNVRLMIQFFSKHLLTTETVLNLPFINPVYCNWHQPISYQIGFPIGNILSWTRYYYVYVLNELFVDYFSELQFRYDLYTRTTVKFTQKEKDLLALQRISLVVLLFTRGSTLRVGGRSARTYGHKMFLKRSR